jgi:AraC-like DNA-binding protein
MAQRYGMHCRFDAAPAVPIQTRDWSAGEVAFVDLTIGRHKLSALEGRAHTWLNDCIFLKLVVSGGLALGQYGQERIFKPGSIVLVDPSTRFDEYVADHTRLIVLRVPKQALRERGFRHAFGTIVAPRPECPDVSAVRDFLLTVAAQSDTPSDAMRHRFGEQCLDLMDILVNDPVDRSLTRSTEATLMRAKRLIAQRLGDATMDVGKIAAEMKISSAYLSRLFKTDGLSVMRYVLSLRLEHAARLLQTSARNRLQVQEVAFQCGFVSAAHFSRAFRQRFGAAPRDIAHAASKQIARRLQVDA